MAVCLFMLVATLDGNRRFRSFLAEVVSGKGDGPENHPFVFEHFHLFMNRSLTGVGLSAEKTKVKMFFTLRSETEPTTLWVSIQPTKQEFVLL